MHSHWVLPYTANHYFDIFRKIFKFLIFQVFSITKFKCVQHDVRSDIIFVCKYHKMPTSAWHRHKREYQGVIQQVKVTCCTVPSYSFMHYWIKVTLWKLPWDVHSRSKQNITYKIASNITCAGNYRPTYVYRVSGSKYV